MSVLDEAYALMYVDAIIPNPNRGVFRVVLGRHPKADPPSARLRVYDIIGNVVLDASNMIEANWPQGSTRTIDVQLSNVPAGIYLVTIENRGKTNTKLVNVLR